VLCWCNACTQDMKGGGAFAFLRIMSAAANLHGSSFLHLWHSVQQPPGAGPKFMIISGSTAAAAELCLTAETTGAEAAGTELLLQPCATAIAAGDGRELFGFEDGQILSMSSRACMVPASIASGGHGRMIFGRCGGEAPTRFELQGNGQVKVVGGSECLTHQGVASGVANVALRAAAVASSSADDLTHGAAMAVDGRSTYWASRFAPTSPEELSIDFGFSARVQGAEIEWEYPAKSFSVQVSEDGARWVEVYSTDINMVNMTRIRLGHILARRAKVVMTEPHALYGELHGRSLYGIRSLSFTAERFQTIVEDCTQAEKCTDARDKFFFVAAGSSDDAGKSQLLRSEVPALDAARASLATVVTSLSTVVPQVHFCRQQPASMRASLEANHTATNRGAVLSIAASPASLSRAIPLAGMSSKASTVEEQNGIDLEAARLLLTEARAAILQVRAALI